MRIEDVKVGQLVRLTKSRATRETFDYHGNMHLAGDVFTVAHVRKNWETGSVGAWDAGGWCYDASDLEPHTPAVDGTSYAATGVERETMHTDTATGGKKGKKLAQLGAIDPMALYTLAEVAGKGCEKYDRYNYAAGYDWSLSIDAAYRHFLKFQAGEDTDLETGLPHVAHAAWHLLALLTFQQRGLGTDDRFPDNKSDGRLN